MPTPQLEQLDDPDEANIKNHLSIRKEEIFPLKEVDYKLYSIDGEIVKTIKVKIPNKSIDYLNKAYPNWKNKFIFSGTHNTYYKLIFNNPFNLLNYFN